jgi:hypothetical protein
MSAPFATPEHTGSGREMPLVVDLDGTLIHSDLLWEAILVFIKVRFL